MTLVFFLASLTFSIVPVGLTKLLRLLALYGLKPSALDMLSKFELGQFST